MFKMDKISNKQNRRDFLISSGRKLFLSGLGIVGFSLGYKTLSADEDTLCEVNLPCRNCFKLGNCEEDKASETRSNLKEKEHLDKKNEIKENG